MSKIPGAYSGEPNQPKPSKGNEQNFKKSFSDVFESNYQKPPEKRPRFPSVFSLSRRGNQKTESQKHPEKKKQKQSFPESFQIPTSLKEEISIQVQPVKPAGVQTVFTSSDSYLVTSCKSETLALYEALVTKITEVTQKGITTTTILLGENAGSFKGCEIKIDHYDTAPHSFNIELSGDPLSTQLFEKHLLNLRTSLENYFPNFTFSRLSTAIKSEPTFQKKIETFPLKKKQKLTPMKTKKVK